MRKLQITRVGNTVIVFVEGLKPIQKTFSNLSEVLEIYDKAINVSTEQEVQEIVDLLLPSKTVEEKKFEDHQAQLKIEFEKKKSLFDFIKDVKEKGHNLFEVKGTSIYLKGINISMPEFLVNSIANSESDEDIKSYINFWKLCALNPDPRAREDIFGFLKGGNFTITPSGYFVAYRNVLVKEKGDSELNKFVSAEYIKLKKWKKSPKNYEVYKTDNGYVTKYMGYSPNVVVQHVGNLDDLYNSIAETSGTVYTDKRTQSFSIKIGELVQMDRTKCDSDPRQDCSYGLHVGNKTFLSRNSFGNVGIAVLVNPSKVVAVPEYNQNKMRVCEYLPICEVEYGQDGKLVEIDTSVLEYEYAEYDQEVIDKMITKSGFSFEELKKNEIIPYEIDHASLRNLSKSLSEMTELVKTRTKSLY